MTRPDLPDLRDLTDAWRVRLDVERLPVIPGRRGNVSACDREHLYVYVTGRTLKPLLRELPAGWRRHQVGDQEANLLAPLAELDRAAEIVRAYRRRRLSPEDVAEKTERLRSARDSRVAGLSRDRKAPETVRAGSHPSAP